MKPIPKFIGLDIKKEEYYSYAETGRLFRLGIKVNTPNTCNWACPYCYVGEKNSEDRPRLAGNDAITKSNKDPLWSSKMKNWIEQGIELGVKVVTINGTFEPTTSPAYKEIIEFCRSQGLIVVLVTNGLNLKQQDIDELYALGISILTKINVPMVSSEDPKYSEYCAIQKKLSGLTWDAEKVYLKQVGLINSLVEAGFNKTDREGKTRLGVESVITTLNVDYIPLLIKQLRNLNIYSHIEITKKQGFVHNNQPLLVSKDGILKLFEEVKKQDQLMGYEEWDIKPPYIAGVCYENLYRLDLHADGVVKPCPGVATNLGSLETQSLKEILANESLQIIRHLDKYIEGDCKSCELFQTKDCYGGCRGTVYQTMMNNGFSEREALVASDPSCHRVKYVLDNGVTADVF